ncbi:putative dUTPase [uncultured Caudovirales phage]|uniref:Putative dUTPase n=1 Tax=uncultured Caudovirales phage TaxID=2100421 RepID=A0A2H4J260_9CAUD|nr:putative dUTPase [uncultured Caudovirales phage]
MMNLNKLFATQKVLRDKIGYTGEDRFHKLILALLVEVGECANEWRGFKFWSKDQEPRTTIGVVKSRNNITGYTERGIKNPLLEEYVDGLHFVLEIGLEIELDDFTYNPSHTYKYKDVNGQFILVSWFVTQMFEDDYYDMLANSYIELGFMLGFTWEQIEQAYFEKNKVNHERQENGY